MRDGQKEKQGILPLLGPGFFPCLLIAQGAVCRIGIVFS